MLIWTSSSESYRISQLFHCHSAQKQTLFFKNSTFRSKLNYKSSKIPMSKSQCQNPNSKMSKSRPKSQSHNAKIAIVKLNKHFLWTYVYFDKNKYSFVTINAVGNICQYANANMPMPISQCQYQCHNLLVPRCRKAGFFNLKNINF